MRVLILHPEDSPRRGPWTRQSWDLIVDLGRSTQVAARAWEEMMHSPLLRSDSFREGVADVRRARKILSAGRGQLMDEEGIDWWTLRSVEVLSETVALMVLQRLAREIPRPATLWATRAGWPASALATMLTLPLQNFGNGLIGRGLGRTQHYARVARNFSAGQIREIIFDKYDASHKWRSRLAARKPAFREPVVLLPSAYTNVSRVASAYARLLPQQSFVLAATRRSATLFDPPPNVHLRDLGAYAETIASSQELKALLIGWESMVAEFRQIPELEMLHRMGILRSFRAGFRSALAVRNAWLTLLEREPVCGVLCGDDSNVHTRLPVLLAARRGLPTLDFHHGAMDGLYLLKDLPSDLYLAKNEMERDYLLSVCGLPSERVVVGAPLTVNSRPVERNPARREDIVFFSEPYELAGMRTEEVYRELLPALCKVARHANRSVILKLHPFESAANRAKIVRAFLSQSDRDFLTIVTGPLSEELLSQTWAGITVESSTVLDCMLRGIPSFLCGWLAPSPFGYLEQFGKYGVGHILRSAEEVADIPRRLADRIPATSDPAIFSKAVEPDMLRQWIAAGERMVAGLRQ